MQRTIMVCTLAGLLLGTRMAAARTLTVAQDGSGQCETITACLQQAGSGDTVLVRNGVYTNEFLHPPAGVTIKAEHAGHAILRYSNTCGDVFPLQIDTANVTIDGLVSDATAVTCGLTQHVRIGPNARNVTLQNAELMGGHNTGQASNSMGIGFTGNGVEAVNQGLIVRNTKIHDIGNDTYSGSGTQSYAIYAASSGILFEHNEVYNIGGRPVHMYCTESGACNDNVFQFNEFHDNWDGVLFASGGSRNVFANNMVRAGGAVGGHAAVHMGTAGAAGGQNQIINNTLEDNQSVCIEIGPSTSNNVITGNRCAGNASDSIQDRSAGGNTFADNTASGGGAGAGVGLTETPSPSPPKPPAPVPPSLAVSSLLASSAP